MATQCCSRWGHVHGVGHSGALCVTVVCTSSSRQARPKRRCMPSGGRVGMWACGPAGDFHHTQAWVKNCQGLLVAAMLPSRVRCFSAAAGAGR